MNMMSNKEVGGADLLKNGMTLKEFRDGIIERTQASGHYNGLKELEFRRSEEHTSELQSRVDIS